jgi:hypothetical protein
MMENMKFILLSLLLLGCSQTATESPDASTADLNIPDTSPPSWTFTQMGTARTLNEDGRALFANVLVKDDLVIATYQIAQPDSLTDGKHLYYQTFDRALNPDKSEDYAINVDSTEPIDWKGDLGDHKLLLVGDSIFMVAIKKGDPLAAVIEFSLDFSYVAGPTYVGNPDKLYERHEDMGFGTNGSDLYLQFFSQVVENDPTSWQAVIYRVNEDLELVDSAFVKPESGSFVTGTSILFVPKGQMKAPEDRLQSFSTNLDYGNSERVGIHTFATDMSLNIIANSTQTIVERELDTYFPVGPSYNTKHQLWIVGYTMENFENEHGTFGVSQELGPSYITIFDADWKELETIQVNEGSTAFRVMTQSVGDDIYVAYDEMDFSGSVSTSRARIERYQIQAQ